MSINMQERISKKRLTEFLMEARSHSGLPLMNPIIKWYVKLIVGIPVSEDVQEEFLDEILNEYMESVHDFKRNNWKSYDW